MPIVEIKAEYAIGNDCVVFKDATYGGLTGCTIGRIIGFDRDRIIVNGGLFVTTVTADSIVSIDSTAT
jgi:hypothetical protein